MTDTKKYLPLKVGMLVRGDLHTKDESQLLARAAELRARHDELMKTNARYAELFATLPNRESWISGVPVNEPVCTTLFSAFRWRLKVESGKRVFHQYSKDREKKYWRDKREQRLKDQAAKDALKNETDKKNKKK